MSAVKTRKLSDLYHKGNELTLDDGEGAVVVWLQKLNPVEAETAIRNANAARARYLMLHRNHDAPEYLAMMSDVLDYSRDEMCKFLAAQVMQKRTEPIEAEVAFDNGWTKEDYLQGIRDSWEDGGLKERYHNQTEEEPDAEAQAAFEEMERFDKEFQARFSAAEEEVIAQYQESADDSLREQMVENLFRLQADMQWLQEFRKSELLLGVKEVGHHKSKYFANRSEIDELEGEILGQLVEGYAALNVTVTQGKGSPETPVSSPESAPPETPETEASSGLVAANH